jgi:hypothetical protein
MRSCVSCTEATPHFTLSLWWTYRRVSSACWILSRYEQPFPSDQEAPYSRKNQVFVEALDRAFENVCELDLVFHFDEVRFYPLGLWTFSIDQPHAQVHHILSEIIQGGIVLETNLDEIDSSGESLQSRLKNFCSVSTGEACIRAPPL